MEVFDLTSQIGAGSAFREELCSMIGATQMFDDFEWHDIEALADYMQAYEAGKGTVLFREGQGGDFLCLIIEGKVDIVKEDIDGKRKTIAVVGPGKTLGEMAIIDGEPCSATAIVSEPVVLTILTQANFFRIINEKPALATKILLKLARLLSQRLRLASGLLVDRL